MTLVTGMPGTLDGALNVDPRIQERRQAVATENRGRRLGRLVTLLLVVALLGAAFGISRSALMDVDSIAVRGAQQVNAERLVAVSGIGTGDALVGLDLDHARAAIAAEPWVEHVEISQYMSGEVVISVTERQPAVALLTSSAAVVVDGVGRVLELREPTSLGQTPELLAISGIELSAVPGHWIDDDTLSLVEAVQALPPEIAGATWGLQMADQGLELYLGSSIGRVILGDARDLDTKIWAIRAFAADVNLQCLDALDLRAPSVPVVTFRENCLPS